MRTPRIDRPVEKTLSIPSSVIKRVNAQLTDRLSDKLPHGAWSRLVSGLLEEWLTKAEKRPGDL